MKGGWSACLEEQHWPTATQLSLAFSQLWTAWYFWLGSIIIIFFFPFKKYEAVGFLPRHTQVGLLWAADFPLGHLILLKKKGKKKKDNSPVTHSVKLKWLRCPLPVPPRLCSLITSLKMVLKGCRWKSSDIYHLQMRALPSPPKESYIL